MGRGLPHPLPQPAAATAAAGDHPHQLSPLVVEEKKCCPGEMAVFSRPVVAVTAANAVIAAADRREGGMAAAATAAGQLPAGELDVGGIRDCKVTAANSTTANPVPFIADEAATLRRKLEGAQLQDPRQ